MDPITAAATASSAFAAIKKGFEIGRDLESMVGDLSRWMGAISDLTEAEKDAQNPPIFKKLFGGQTVEAEAMATFAAKRKAEQQRAELKTYIQYTMGMSAWEELVRMEGQIRKTRKETIYKQAKRRRKFMEIVGIILVVGALIGGSVLMFMLVYSAVN
jgi:hypothetical protein